VEEDELLHGVVARIHEALGELNQIVKRLGISSLKGLVKQLESLQNPVVVLPQGPGYILHADPGHGPTLVYGLKHFWLITLTYIIID
jgi:hypothetical protein